MRAEWGEPEPTGPPPLWPVYACALHGRCVFGPRSLDCRYLGKQTPIKVPCTEGCNKSVRLFVFECSKHRECTKAKHGLNIGHCCRDCPDRTADPFQVINHTDGGIGDALLGLLAVKALKAQSKVEIVYKVPGRAIPFVRLFDGYDHLAEHDLEERKKVGETQINDRHRARETRLQRYQRNLGITSAIFPALREPLPYADSGTILLAPFSTGEARNYPLEHWLKLEQLLLDAGQKVVVMDDRYERCGGFVSAKMLCAPAISVTAAVQNAKAVVSCESGLAHLAGVLRKPVLVLCSITFGEVIHNAYPQSVCLQSPPGTWMAPEEAMRRLTNLLQCG